LAPEVPLGKRDLLASAIAAQLMNLDLIRITAEPEKPTISSRAGRPTTCVALGWSPNLISEMQMAERAIASPHGQPLS
jgi:hypothetical protein